jgi:D-lactate dehydrogenase (cytochrome)
MGSDPDPDFDSDPDFGGRSEAESDSDIDLDVEAGVPAFLEGVLPPDRISRDPGTRREHATDFATPESEGVEPAVVVAPESTAEVAALLAAADERGVPVTPYAGGSGLEGGAVPRAAGVSLDVTRMDSVLAVRPADNQITVEAGLFGDDLRAALAEHDRFLPALPASHDVATAGGMIATDASGMGTVKYGEVGDWVLGLEAVLADGTVVETGSGAKKTSAGYNLTDLLVGNEGTLAVLTRVTFAVAPRPGAVRGGRAVFGSLEAAGNAVAAVVREGLDVAKLELMGPTAAAMANAHLGLALPDSPMLFFEVHAPDDAGARRRAERVREAFDRSGMCRFDAADGEDLTDLWRARTEMAYAQNEYDPDRELLHAGDVTVPVGAYPDLVRYATALAEEYDLLVPCFGHAGDGNLHYSPVVDRDDSAEVERGREVYHRLVERALDLDGTCTGEHGVGTGKREYLERELGAGAVDAMHGIKAALDPNGTLNPGTALPDPDSDSDPDRETG